MNLLNPQNLSMLIPVFVAVALTALCLNWRRFVAFVWLVEARDRVAIARARYGTDDKRTRAAVKLERFATRAFKSGDFAACEIASYRSGKIALGHFDPSLADQPIPFALVS